MPTPLKAKPLRALLAGAFLLAGTTAGAAKQLTVTVDHAVPFRLPVQAAAVIVGNPAIADAHVQDGRLLFVLGRTFGITNVIAVDDEGQEIADVRVVVEGTPRGEVTLHRGAVRETYACANVCERALKVGDAKEGFDIVNQQAKSRSGLALSAAQN
jgi:Flp pilus assembly secretin CpaC